MLFALDPYESNEAIVSQRRLLSNGSPKHIRVRISDGFLSLHGDVSIKGITVSLPSIRRLNIARIPGIEKFEEELTGLAKVIEILEILSAENLIINKNSNSINYK